MYYIVGTVMVNSSGRSHDHLLPRGRDKGAIYSLVEFHGRVLATTSYSKVYERTEEKLLRHESNHLSNILKLFCKTKDDFILVSNLNRSISRLQHKPIKDFSKRLLATSSTSESRP